ncbi:MAG: YhdP family protein, partial [Gammaproteobacteria bacterium]
GFSSKEYPSVQGLDGYLQYKNHNALLRLDASNAVMDFNGLFRNAIDLTSLKGDVYLSRESTAWHINSQHIQVNSPHLETASRVHVKIADDEPVFADLVTRFSNGDIRHKGLYFPTAIMKPNLTAWLDRALVSGRIADGGFLLHGSLADFPYVKNRGMFEVEFDVENAVLDYRSNWPAINHMNSSVRFHKRAMNILGEAKVYGASLKNTQVDIENLSKAHLSVDSKIRSPLPDLLRYIENSPLQDMVGSYVSDMKTQGTSGLVLNLQIPLAEEKPVRFNSRLTFQGNDILLPQEGYQFNAVRGSLIINDKEVRADNLVASLDGYPVKASVATVENKIGKITRVSAAGDLPVTSLLAPVPFLKPYISGESNWKVTVDIPNNSNITDLVISVESRLHGVSSDLPLPFKKTEDVQAPFNMDLSILKEGGLQLDVNFENHYRLKSTRQENIWRVDMDSSILQGKARFNQDFSVDYPMTLDIDLMDLGAYLNQSDEDKNADSRLEVGPNYFPDIQLQARKVIWKDLQVNDASLETRRSKLGMDINHFEMHGPALSIMGKGSWHSSWLHNHVTSLEMNISSNDFGKFLSEVGITKGLKKASGQASINWQWYSEPYKFDWRRLQGEMQLAFENGRLLDINPGAGRVLGLLNFETLLSLDFGNQVSEGFAFDEIEGSFTFANGNAYTTNMNIDSKVAEISMTGRIGLSTEDYDQIVTVVPGVGSTLTVLGAVAGGPTLAAAVLFLQKILGLNRIAEYKYSIRGDWEKPEVKLLVAPDNEE